MNPDDAAFEHCRRETRRLAQNFYAGMKLTPEPGFSALCCIYLWMAAVDAVADDDDRPVAERRAELEAYRNNTREVLFDRVPLGPDAPDWVHWSTFHRVGKRFALPGEAFDGVIDGQLADLDFRQPADESELDAYCGQVASTVGRICVAVWGGDPEDTDALAQRRGVALQRTNILRDVVEDAARGRVYLAADALRRHGVDAAELAEPPADADAAGRLRGLLAEQAALAREHFDATAGLEDLLPVRSRASSRAIAGVYAALLARIEADPLAVLRGRVSVPAAEKLRIVGGAWLDGRRGR